MAGREGKLQYRSMNYKKDKDFRKRERDWSWEMLDLGEGLGTRESWCWTRLVGSKYDICVLDVLGLMRGPPICRAQGRHEVS